MVFVDCLSQEAELERLHKAREEELEYVKKKNELEIIRQKQMSDIEIAKITSVIQSLGAETIQNIASAGQDFQVIVSYNILRYFQDKLECFKIRF